MAIDIILYILTAVCLAASIVGCIVPALPGPPLAFVGLLLLSFTDVAEADITALELSITFLVAVAISVADYVMPVIGTKKFGGTKWGNWGCVIGSIIGLFFPPVGIILGPFIGATVGELIGGKQFSSALKAGFGSFLGFFIGTLLKFFFCAYVTIRCIVALF